MFGRVFASRYRIEALLGEGGMGAVYAGTDLTSGARVAIKVMLTPDFALSGTLVARFEREARAASSLDTDNVVKVLDFGTDAELGAPFMVLEFLSGSDVEKAVKQHGPLPIATSLRIVAQAAVGLARAHDRGIIHRDIKSANLYLHEVGDGSIRVKVLDFGIAKVLLDDLAGTGPAALTQTGALLGSPLYMSPEQAQGLKSVDHRTDIWSLGMVLYEALSGKTPFVHAESIGQLIFLICSETPEPVERVAPWLPKELGAVVGRCLRRDPEERFPSARALGAALGQILGGNDFSLRKADVRALEASERAPRTVLPTDTLPASMDDVRLAASAGAVPAQSASPATPLGHVAGTADGVAATATHASAKRASWPWLVAGAGALAATTGAIVMRSPADTHPAASAAAPVNESPRERSFRLAVGPAGVTAEVEGKPLAVVDGAVIVTGAPGKTLLVRLSLGEHTVAREVALTEQGPLPASLVMDLPPAAAASSATALPSAAPAKSKARKPETPPSAASAAPGPASKVVPAAAEKLQQKFE